MAKRFTPEFDKKIFDLKKQGYTDAEIARKENINRKSVKPSFERAEARLSEAQPSKEMTKQDNLPATSENKVVIPSGPSSASPEGSVSKEPLDGKSFWKYVEQRNLNKPPTQCIVENHLSLVEGTEFEPAYLVSKKYDLRDEVAKKIVDEGGNLELLEELKQQGTIQSHMNKISEAKQELTKIETHRDVMLSQVQKLDKNDAELFDKVMKLDKRCKKLDKSYKEKLEMSKILDNQMRIKKESLARLDESFAALDEATRRKKAWIESYGREQAFKVGEAAKKTVAELCINNRYIINAVFTAILRSVSDPSIREDFIFDLRRESGQASPEQIESLIRKYGFQFDLVQHLFEVSMKRALANKMGSNPASEAA